LRDLDQLWFPARRRPSRYCDPAPAHTSESKDAREGAHPAVRARRDAPARGRPLPNRSLALAQGGVGETASCRCGGEATWNRYRTR
jgi:hypothetical protein